MTPTPFSHSFSDPEVLEVADGSEFWKICAYCGDSLIGKAWPPLVTERRTVGETTLHSFCDERCKTAWEAGD